MVRIVGVRVAAARGQHDLSQARRPRPDQSEDEVKRLVLSHSLAFASGVCAFAYASWLWLDRQTFGV